MARIATRKHSILAAYARQRWRRFSRNLRFAFGFAINIWHWDHFFLQFSHNKYAILSYKGEEKRITSETLHSTDLLPFVCSPIFPDLSHYDYFSKSLRRFSCHHSDADAAQRARTFIYSNHKEFFFSIFLLEVMKVHYHNKVLVLLLWLKLESLAHSALYHTVKF